MFNCPILCSENEQICFLLSVFKSDTAQKESLESFRSINPVAQSLQNNFSMSYSRINFFEKATFHFAVGFLSILDFSMASTPTQKIHQNQTAIYKFDVEEDISVHSYFKYENENGGYPYIIPGKSCLSTSSQPYKRMRSDIKEMISATSRFILKTSSCFHSELSKYSETRFSIPLAGFSKNTRVFVDIFYLDSYPQDHKSSFQSYGENPRLRKFYSGGSIRELDELNALLFREASTLSPTRIVPDRADMTGSTPIAISRSYVSPAYTIPKFLGFQIPVPFDLSGAAGLVFYMNVDSAELKFSEYDDINFDPLEIRHFRKPIIEKKQDGRYSMMSTAQYLVLSMYKEDLVQMCSDLSREYSSLKATISEGEYYKTVIERLGKIDSRDLNTIALTFFYDSQRDIESAIEMFESSISNDDIEGQLFLESLSAISLIKGNSCLKDHLSMNMLRSDPSQSMKYTRYCSQKGQITSNQQTILEKLISLGENNYQISENLRSTIDEVASRESKKKTRFIDLRNQLRSLIVTLPDQSNSWCTDALGSEIFSEIIQ